MNKEAKLELEFRYRLYELYVNTTGKGIAFFIAIQGALLTLAATKESRAMFSIAALMVCLATLLPLLGSIAILKKMGGDFSRLAAETGTKAIEVWPVLIFWLGTMLFWLLCVGGWTYIYYTM